MADIMQPHLMNKIGNYTLQKGTNMLINSLQYAAKIGGKKSDSIFLQQEQVSYLVVEEREKNKSKLFRNSYHPILSWRNHPIVKYLSRLLMAH